MVFKVLSLKQDKNFTINFSILNRVSSCSGNLTLCPDSDSHPISPDNNTALGLSLRAGGQGFPLAIMNDLSSWASDLFHLLAHYLVSKKVSVEYWVTF